MAARSPGRKADEALLTPSQVAAQLGVDQRTIRRWVTSGLIPASHTVTGNHLIAPSTVQALQQLINQGVPINGRTLRGRFNQEDRQPTD